MQQLEQCLSRVPFYQNIPRIRQDVQQVMYNCTTLRPNVGIFQSPNNGGPSQLTLFYLSGVVPIMYHGVTYNIPVTVYLDPPYPNVPPRVFVTPTSDMIIKPNHRYVDGNGRVYLPQISQWNAYRSSLAEIVGVCSSTFSAEPPVVSVPKQSVRPAAPVTATVISHGPVLVSGPSRRDQLTKSITIKIRAKLPVKLKSEIDAINDYRQRAIKYLDHGKKLHAIGSELSIIRSACEKKKEEVDGLIHETSEWLIERKSTSLDDSDRDTLSYLDAETVVGQQVVDLMAEECAIEDLIDLLNERNRSGLLSMSELLREVRALTRKLFEIKFIKDRCLVVVKTRVH
jgi:ESCRT-I complex subunit TSG101